MIHLFPTDIQSIIFEYLSRDDYLSVIRAYQNDIKRCLKGIHFDFEYLVSQLTPKYYKVSFLYSKQAEDKMDVGKYSNLDHVMLGILEHLFCDQFYLWENTYNHYFYVLKDILDVDKINYDHIIRKYNIPCELIGNQQYSYDQWDELIKKRGVDKMLDKTLGAMMRLSKEVLKRHYFENKGRDYENSHKYCHCPYLHICDFPQLKLTRDDSPWDYYTVCERKFSLDDRDLVDRFARIY